MSEAALREGLEDIARCPQHADLVTIACQMAWCRWRAQEALKCVEPDSENEGE